MTEKSAQKITLDLYTRPDLSNPEISITTAWSPLVKLSLQNQF